MSGKRKTSQKDNNQKPKQKTILKCYYVKNNKGSWSFKKKFVKEDI